MTYGISPQHSQGSLLEASLLYLMTVPEGGFLGMDSIRVSRLRTLSLIPLVVVLAVLLSSDAFIAQSVSRLHVRPGVVLPYPRAERSRARTLSTPTGEGRGAYRADRR